MIETSGPRTHRSQEGQTPFAYGTARSNGQNRRKNALQCVHDEAYDLPFNRQDPNREALLVARSRPAIPLDGELNFCVDLLATAAAAEMARHGALGAKPPGMTPPLWARPRPGLPTFRYRGRNVSFSKHLPGTHARSTSRRPMMAGVASCATARRNMTARSFSTGCFLAIALAASIAKVDDRDPRSLIRDLFVPLVPGAGDIWGRVAVETDGPAAILEALPLRDFEAARRAMWPHLENIRPTLVALSDAGIPNSTAIAARRQALPSRMTIRAGRRCPCLPRPSPSRGPVGCGWRPPRPSWRFPGADPRSQSLPIKCAEGAAFRPNLRKNRQLRQNPLAWARRLCLLGGEDALREKTCRSRPPSTT